MSLVGTRPPTVDEWDKYELHHRARLATKPGLTGMWQVSGRSNITDLIYSKLKTTSVTIIIITPQAINHKKDMWGRYDDWMYDEIRYSLEDRENNRCNGIVAVYTPEAKEMLMKETLHNYIESYKEEVSDIKYGEDISGEKIYDNMVKINDLVKTQLF